MNTLHDAARWVHIGVGLVALTAFWTAGFARKGGLWHRRAGAIYVRTMAVVLGTAALLTMTTAARGHWMGAIFLAYLLAITATSLWMGWRALGYKQDAVGYARGAFPVVACLNIVAAVALVGVGWRTREAFLVGLSLIGFLIGIGAIQMWRRPPTHPRFWLKEHIGGMFGAGIATHIAFASIGLRALFPEAETSVTTIWPWLVPLVVGFGAGAMAERRYVVGAAAVPEPPEAAPPPNRGGS